MTFLHHAVNAQSDKNFDYETGQCRSPEAVDDNDHGHAPFAPSIAANGVVPTVIERCCCGCYMHAEDVDIAVELNPWLPIIWDALHFSRRSLSLPEVTAYRYCTQTTRSFRSFEGVPDMMTRMRTPAETQAVLYPECTKRDYGTLVNHSLRCCLYRL